MVIVSRDIIKPSSPTPSHRKIYNLLLLDQLAINAYIPMVTFFPSSGIHRCFDNKTTKLKNSLSQTLTQYYPFAGMMPKIGQTVVNCNDNGVEFIEATNDRTLLDFLQNSDHKDLDQLCPDDLIWFKPNHTVNNDENNITNPILAVQINHFACGGVAVAVSLSHKIRDSSSLFNFVNHWAIVTRFKNKDATEINPHFITNYQPTNVKVPEILPERQEGDDCVTRSFVFPNSKKNDLRAMVMAAAKEFGQPITNPTHDEALTWLIHNCAMAAATKTNLGTFKPTGLGQIMNMRNNFIEPLPKTSIGNIYQVMDFPTRNESEMTPNTIIGELRKRKAEVRSIRNIENMIGMIAEIYSETGMVEMLKKLDVYYLYTFLNRFPAYGVDFGWGTPVKVTIAGTQKNVAIFMASPNGEGIEALVSLERQDMEIFQNDPHLLAFAS